MRRYKRYMVLNLLLPTIVVAMTLTGIIWLTQALRFVDLIVNRGLDVSTFLYLATLLVPSLMLIILPVALFSAVLYVYNKYIIDSELIVLKSAGLSRLSLSSPALLVAGLVAFMGYVFSLYLLPVSYREFKDTQAFIRDNYASVLLQEGVFNSPTKGLTVYIETRGDDGLLEGILVHDERNKVHPVTMMAQEGTLVKKDGGPSFHLVNGNRQEVDKNGNLSVLYFDSYPLDLSMYTKNKTARKREAEERFLGELFFPEEGISQKDRGKFLAEAHHRLVWPLYSVALAVVALACLLSGQLSRRGQWNRIMVAAVGGVLAVSGDLGLKSMVASTPSLAPLLYGYWVIFMAAGVYVLLSHRTFDLAFTLPWKKEKQS